jgi:transmembrane sensor
MEKPVSKRMLFDFFSEKTTSMQRKLIEEWLNDQQNQELFYHYLDEWERQSPQFNPDYERAIQQYRIVLEGENPGPHRARPAVPLLSPPLIVRKWLIAASILVLGLFVFRKELIYRSLTSATEHSTSYRLSDGTTVLLHANSTLTVPRFGFGAQSREVFLEGEADFNVTHTRTHKRFIVNMGDAYQIEVLGTQFVAYARNHGKRVFLSHGKVKVQLPEGKQLYMKPGNLFTSTPRGDFQVTVPSAPEKYTAWREQLFYFDNTPLTEVAQQMKERFDIDLRIKDSLLLERRIGGIYRAESPDDLLQILTELLQVEVVKNQSYIELNIPKNK